MEFQSQSWAWKQTEKNMAALKRDGVKINAGAEYNKVFSLINDLNSNFEHLFIKHFNKKPEDLENSSPPSSTLRGGTG